MSIDDIEQRAGDPWDPPVPLPVAPPAPEFPRGVLPHWIQARCDNLAAHMRVPVELPVTVALGTLSAALTHGRATLTVTDGWTEAANLYLVCAMPPGSGKSPVFNALTAPLDDLADQWKRQHEDAARHALAHRKVAELAVKDAEMSGNTDELIAALEALDDAALPDEPEPILDDTNTESLEKALAANRGTVAVLSDEAGVLDTVSRLVETGRSANIQTLLQAWSGGDVKVSRLSRSAQIRRARATMLLTPQPRIVESLIKADPDFTGRGLSDRFMIAVPPSLVGQRDYTTIDPLDPVAAHQWTEHLTEITRTHPWGRTDDITYRLATDAYNAFNAWRNTLEARRGADGPLSPLAGIPEKVTSSVLRLALILHVADGFTPNDDVDIHTYRRAEAVGEWWLGHAVAAYGDLSPEMAEAQDLIDWLVNEHDNPIFTTRDINRGGRFRRSRDTAEELLDLVARLVERDLVRPLRPNWRTPKRGQRNEFECHPDLRATLCHARHLDHGNGSEPLSVDEGGAHGAHVTKGSRVPPPPSLSTPSAPEPGSARHARQPNDRSLHVVANDELLDELIAGANALPDPDPGDAA
ncbi:MAG: YfjI family protein [Actinomycetota bacterium]